MESARVAAAPVYSQDDNPVKCAVFVWMRASAIFLSFFSPVSNGGCMCKGPTEIESQPWGRACDEKAAHTAEWNGAQVSSRLIWKLCNEGPTVYI